MKGENNHYPAPAVKLGNKDNQDSLWQKPENLRRYNKLIFTAVFFFFLRNSRKKTKKKQGAQLPR